MDAKIEVYKNICSDFWVVFKKHFGVRQDDDLWKNCVMDFDAVMAKYSKSEQKMFAWKMYITFMQELERVSKGE